MPPECQGGQDADFPAGVMPIHIGGGVPFRITQILCQFQRRIKIHLLLDHFGQDEISGPVQDTGDFINLIRGQTKMHRADNRDPPANRRFKIKIAVVLLGQTEQLRTFCGNQLFIGGHNAFPPAKGSRRVFVRRRKPSHHFNYNGNFIIIKNFVKIRCKPVAVIQPVKTAQIQNPFHFNRLACPAADTLLVIPHQFTNARTDDPMS